MKIINHILQDDDIKYIESPNFKKEFKPGNLQYLVMHFTGGTTLEGAVNTFLDDNSKVSAHIIIDRDGTIVQMVPFNYIAWHAGKSEWEGKKYLNNYSIGIEFVNAGKLKDVGNNIYKDEWWHKFEWKDIYIFTDSRKFKDENGMRNYDVTFWQKFTNIQIERGVEITKLLLNEYKIIDIIGHSDISPGRKIDPGYAFPMEIFKGWLLNGKIKRNI